MSTPPDKPAPPIRWETIERVAAKAEAERLEGMSEKELDALLGKAGFDAGNPNRVARRALGERRRPRWVVVVLAAAAVLVVVLAWKRREVVAFFTGTPEPNRAGRAAGADAEEQAAKLRGEALAACGLGQWDACRGKLDVAKALDPAGEADPRVAKAREDIAAALAFDASAPDKPRPR